MTGKEFRDTRISLGFTQKEMGEHLDLTQTWISKIENGKVKISHRIELAITLIVIMNKGIIND